MPPINNALRRSERQRKERFGMQLDNRSLKRVQSDLALRSRPVAPCPCECNGGGFCGGCGHAGCTGGINLPRWRDR